MYGNKNPLLFLQSMQLLTCACGESLPTRYFHHFLHQEQALPRIFGRGEYHIEEGKM
jgi:hypothetical protein